MKNLQSSKTYRRVSFFGAILLIAFLISCKKSSLKSLTMPAATQNGSNTMGAYINSALWIPELSFNGTGIDAACSLPLLSISGMANTRDHQNKTGLTIYIRNFSGVGAYALNASAYGITGNTAECSTAVNKNYITDSLHQGKVVITKFDINKHIVSGTFQINLINTQSTTDSLNISGGRFDVTYPLTQLN